MVDVTKQARPRRSKFFWVPPLIVGGGCIAAAVYAAGAYFTKENWLEEEKAELALTAMRSPSAAIETAEQRLLERRIDFPLYRDLLRVALQQQNPEVRAAANQSIARLASSKLAFADDLKKELVSMPPQVFLVTSPDGTSAAHDIEQKLKRRETVIVTHESRPPSAKPIVKSEVFCYDQEVCKQIGQAVFNLLQQEGFDVAGPTRQDAGATLFKKRVEVVLAGVKKAEAETPRTKKTIIKKSRRKSRR